MNIQEAQKYFSKDNYAVQTTGIQLLEIGDGYSKCSLKLDKRHMNAVGKPMGGVFFTLADFSFAAATNSKEKWTVTTTSQITYLSMVKGDTLISECKTIKDGKSLVTCEISITDNLGTPVAIIISNGMHLTQSK